VFDATTAKFRDINFERVNLDENKDLAEKYSIKTIPRMVMLDASSNVIFNGSPPRSEETLAALIGQHR